MFTVDVTDYCKAHPKVILPDPDNCAHYFNCSDATTATITRATMAAGNYRKECHYPDLYDDSIKQCNKFEMVNCSKKPEPQAPCKFEIYILLTKLYISGLLQCQKSQNNCQIV
jgi:hypothetical protein